MLRCLKNDNGVIIAIGTNEDQSGPDAYMPGTWCTWTVAEDALPSFSDVEGAADRALRYKENGTADGIELRTDAEVLEAPQG